MNKKLIFNILILSFIFIGTLYSQKPKWVSTEVQNRVAVLEHFTAIYGSNSPKGHKRANEISQAYPGKFIIINNNCGPYARPFSVNSPDLRTDEGDSIFYSLGIDTTIMEIENINKYPGNAVIGSINRSTDPWEIIYDDWESTAKNIMDQPSIVNIYIKPDINFRTRELAVEVEYYYTDDSPAAENYLTVMLLQNEIIGYQSNGILNPEYLVDKKKNEYRHMHTLRKVISNGGVWGDPITDTKKGSYECRKYTIVLPDSINNVKLDLENIEIAAFISESKDNIYTGYKVVIPPPEDIKTDLSLIDVSPYHNNYKFETLRPKFRVTNNYDSIVTKFDITYNLAAVHYSYDNEVIVEKYDTIITKTETYSGKLIKGASDIIEFPEINQDIFNVSSNYIVQASISNIYRNDSLLIDIDTTNNATKTSKICMIDTLFSETVLTFENPDTASTIGLLPAHAVMDHSLNSCFGLDNRLCGAKNTKTAVLFLLNSFYGVSSKPGYIVFGKIDCKDNPNKILSYYYAYSDGRESGTPPRIVIDISNDWGKNWDRISEIFCKETGELDESESIYLPTPDEYRFVQVDLSDYLKENVFMRIGCIPGSNGNAVLLDEISLKNAPEESIKEDINLSVYPNPASNILHINNDNLLNEEYEIYDMSGKLIIKDITNTNIINIENLSTGTYSIKIKDSIFNFIKK